MCGVRFTVILPLLWETKQKCDKPHTYLQQKHVLYEKVAINTSHRAQGKVRRYKICRQNL